MRGVLSWLGLAADRPWIEEQAVEDAKAWAHMEYIWWLCCRWPDGALWKVTDDEATP